MANGNILAKEHLKIYITKKTFTTNKSNASHVFTGRTTIDKLITYELNGKSYTPTKRKIMYYASSLRRAIK